MSLLQVGLVELNILSNEPGTTRKATFSRFQQLMAPTRKVRSDSSFSE